jgi:transketolase
MRKTFAAELYNQMKINDNIIVLVADLGYGMFDHIKSDFPNQFINVGASEQAMVDIGIGIALEHKKPILYSITPFLLYRAFESLRTYVNHEKIPVILVGSGRDKDYSHDGISHWAEDDYDIMQNLKNIQRIYPHNKEMIKGIIEEILYVDYPVYLNLKR